MKPKLFKSFQAKAGAVERRWLEIDAEGQVLGRLAAELARILQGKHRPTYTPHVDTGDFVVVVNADKVVLTGRKTRDKKYYYYTGYIDGLREIPYPELAANKPGEALRLAVRRMLPKTKLGRQMFAKLKVYAGTEHPHGAQQPEKLELKL